MFLVDDDVVVVVAVAAAVRVSDKSDYLVGND